MIRCDRCFHYIADGANTMFASDVPRIDSEVPDLTTIHIHTQWDTRKRFAHNIEHNIDDDDASHL